jgi:hypothetical protein
MKDRSIARNGRDKSLKKGGFNGWGDLKHEAELEQEAQEDEARERAEELREERTNGEASVTTATTEEEVSSKRARRPSTLGEVPGEPSFLDVVVVVVDSSIWQ